MVFILVALISDWVENEFLAIAHTSTQQQFTRQKWNFHLALFLGQYICGLILPKIHHLMFVVTYMKERNGTDDVFGFHNNSHFRCIKNTHTSYLIYWFISNFVYECDIFGAFTINKWNEKRKMKWIFPPQ